MTTLRKTIIDRFPALISLYRALYRALNIAMAKLRPIPSQFTQYVIGAVSDGLWEIRINWTSLRVFPDKLKKPIIHLYAVCYNEERIIPYFIDYYSKFVDEFIIYDNMSTDSSVSKLSRYKGVTVIPYDTGNTLDETARLNIKNQDWKKSKGHADFVIVCDMDEFLYHRKMGVLLHLLHKHGYTVMQSYGYDMVSQSLPEFAGNQAITQLIRTGFASKNYSKPIFFSPELAEINFAPGCHKAAPKGRIKLFRSKQFKLLHYKNIDRNWVLRKTQHYRNRVSETNKRHGWGIHYQRTDEGTLADFDHKLKLGRKVI
jgi:hypothetical protein